MLAAHGSLVWPQLWVHLSPTAAAAVAEAAADPPSVDSFDADFCARARAYIATVRGFPFTFGDDMKGEVQGYLSTMRTLTATAASARSTGGVAPAGGSARDVFGPGDMHRVLNLARLSAASYGERELCPERWETVKALEARRLASLQIPPAASGGRRV